MTREEFSEIYTGHALVISDPQEVNQTNNTTSTVQPENLTTEMMQSIKGQQLSASIQLTAMKSIRGKK